jgi:UPF0716 family protein affecting phage T7 exclusion
MVEALTSWLSQPAVMWAMIGFSVLAFVGSVLLVPRYLAHLPEDYLVRRHSRYGPAQPIVLRVLKNLLGIVLLLAGVLMLVLPGQGLITLLIGVTLLDFPGKRQLVRRAVGRPKVLDAVNRLRERAGKPPLLAPAAE